MFNFSVTIAELSETLQFIAVHCEPNSKAQNGLQLLLSKIVNMHTVGYVWHHTRQDKKPHMKKTQPANERDSRILRKSIKLMERFNLAGSQKADVNSKTPFTRYNRLSNRLSNGFDNRFDNGFDNQLYRVYKHLSGCQTALTTGLTIGCIV